MKKVTFTYKAQPHGMVRWKKHIGTGGFKTGVRRRVTTLVEFAREVVAAARRHGEENVYALGYRKPRRRA